MAPFETPAPYGFSPSFGQPPMQFSAGGSMFNGSMYHQPYSPSFLGGMLGPQADMLIQALLPMFGGFAGQGFLQSNPFQPSSYLNFSGMQQDRSLGQMAMAAQASNVELQRINGRRISNLITGMNGIMPSWLPQMSNNFGTDVAGFMSNPMMMMGMSMAGIDPSMIFPETYLPMTSARILSRGSLSPNVGMVSEMSSTFASHAGYRGDQVDSRRSFGFTAYQYAGIAEQLQARGFAGLSAEQIAYDAGSPLGAAGMSKRLNAALESQVDPYISTFAATRDILGIKDPGQQMQAIQAISGNGLGRVSSDQLTSQVIAFKELVKTAGIAQEALVQLIESTSSLAQQNGLSGTAAARTVMDVVGLTQAAGNANSNRLGGALTPGVVRDANQLTEQATRRALSVQGSALAQHGAVAYDILQKYANSTGTTVEDLAGSNSVLQSVLALKAGDGSESVLNNVGNSATIAAALSKVTGRSISSIRADLGDRGYAQAALEANPDFIMGAMANVTFDNTRQHLRAIRRITGNSNLSLESADAIMNVIKSTSRGTFDGSDALRAGLGEALGNDSPLIDNVMGHVTELNREMGDRTEADANYARLDKSVRANMRAKRSAQLYLSKAIGGRAAGDEFTRALAEGRPLASITGARSRQDILMGLSANSEFLANIIKQDDVSFEATVSSLDEIAGDQSGAISEGDATLAERLRAVRKVGAMNNMDPKEIAKGMSNVLAEVGGNVREPAAVSRNSEMITAITEGVNTAWKVIAENLEAMLTKVLGQVFGTGSVAPSTSQTS